MVHRGRVFRRAFSWLPAQFGSRSEPPGESPGESPKGDTPRRDPPVTRRRQFGSTEHLSVEAIAAFVDGELRMNAHLRAAHHLSLCPQCAAEVEDQRRARAALRDSRPIPIPSALLGLLSDIPRHPPDPPDSSDEGKRQ